MSTRRLNAADLRRHADYDLGDVADTGAAVICLLDAWLSIAADGPAALMLSREQR